MSEKKCVDRFFKNCFEKLIKSNAKTLQTWLKIILLKIDKVK